MSQAPYFGPTKKPNGLPYIRATANAIGITKISDHRTMDQKVLGCGRWPATIQGNEELRRKRATTARVVPDPATRMIRISVRAGIPGSYRPSIGLMKRGPGRRGDSSACGRSKAWTMPDERGPGLVRKFFMDAPTAEFQ